jgi:hypothetical protein
LNFTNSAVIRRIAALQATPPHACGPSPCLFLTFGVLPAFGAAEDLCQLLEHV